jgi:glutathione peroxidase
MKRSILTLRLLLAASLLAAPAMAGPSSGAAFQFEFVSIDGQPMPLDRYRGKVLLIVNTASQCGHTPQYKALQTLWDKYRDRGLVVIGVPSNDFGRQEPDGEAEIAQFSKTEFGVTFPLTKKYEVSGEEAHPFYRWAARSASAPRWNFHKYLVSRDGRLAASFPSMLDPAAPDAVEKIETELAKAAAL